MQEDNRITLALVHIRHLQSQNRLTLFLIGKCCADHGVFILR